MVKPETLDSIIGSRYAEISFELDCCLHLPEDQIFTVNETNNRSNSPAKSALKFSDVRKNDDHRYGSSNGWEIMTDSNAAFRFSKLHLYFPVALDDNRENILDNYENKAMSIINYFLDIYRYVTKRYAIKRIVTLRDKPNLIVAVHGEDDKVNGMNYFGFGGLFGGYDGVLTNTLPDRSLEEISEIMRILGKGTQVHSAQLLLMNASRLIKEGYNYLALTNMVSGLEATVYDLYQNKLSNVTRPTDIENFFKKGGHLYKKIEWSILSGACHLKLKFSNNDLVKINKLIDDRNAYIHENKESLSFTIFEYQAIAQKYTEILDL
jgi:hypothetical protein